MTIHDNKTWQQKQRHTKHPHCMRFCSKLSHSVSARDLWKKCTREQIPPFLVYRESSVCLNTSTLKLKINLSYLVSIINPFYQVELRERHSCCSFTSKKIKNKNFCQWHGIQKPGRRWPKGANPGCFSFLFHPCLTLICKKSLSCLDQVKLGINTKQLFSWLWASVQ